MCVCVCACVRVCVTRYGLILQILCFDAPLQPQALMDIKLIIQKNVENGVVAEGISLEGGRVLRRLVQNL